MFSRTHCWRSPCSVVRTVRPPRLRPPVAQSCCCGRHGGIHSHGGWAGAVSVNDPACPEMAEWGGAGTRQIGESRACGCPVRSPLNDSVGEGGDATDQGTLRVLAPG
eukprot:gene8966-biopygen15212